MLEQKYPNAVRTKTERAVRKTFSAETATLKNN
jgi:hypothetical protein